MNQDANITDIMQQRQDALDEAYKKKEKFFKVVKDKGQPLVDNLVKYKMSFVHVPFSHNESYGKFSLTGKSYIMVTPKGLGLVDLTKDAQDASRYIEISMKAYDALPEESDRGDFINLVMYIIQNMDAMVRHETESIYAFYKDQAEKARENSNGWDQLIENLA